ncbi:MAG TPA: type II toxin-antitoxin system VapC family toxin [Jatrophihabitans sp.]|nr:type II toxin-antitoxin system VapC family toxin [Jatrophihabitans sp.]
MAATGVTEASRYRRALLDTSVVVDYPADDVARQTKSASISTISLAELAYGLHTHDALLNAAREQRYHWIVATFDPIPFDADCSRTYGALCALVRDAGRSPRPRRFDLLIAATAIAYSLPLLTRNAADFADLHPALILVPVRY